MATPDPAWRWRWKLEVAVPLLVEVTWVTVLGLVVRDRRRLQPPAPPIGSPPVLLIPPVPTESGGATVFLQHGAGS